MIRMSVGDDIEGDTVEFPVELEYDTFHEGRPSPLSLYGSTMRWDSSLTVDSFILHSFPLIETQNSCKHRTSWSFRGYPFKMGSTEFNRNFSISFSAATGWYWYTTLAFHRGSDGFSHTCLGRKSAIIHAVSASRAVGPVINVSTMVFAKTDRMTLNVSMWLALWMSSKSIAGSIRRTQYTSDCMYRPHR